jgi:gluconokinase
VNGSGDGFFATLGSDCVRPGRVSISLGTSASARQTLNDPALDESAGTFCYRAAAGSFLLGCASNNGGNVLDWGRSIFGSAEAAPSRIPPVFLPQLHGERSPDWNPRLTGSWHGLTSLHTSADLSRSILEGVVFNLAHYAEILQRVSGVRSEQIVLSGNGFLEPATAHVLAGLVKAEVRMPVEPGFMTLRGAAICAFEALGAEVPPLHTTVVRRKEEPGLRERFERYKALRAEKRVG